MAALPADVIDRIRRPEYTGENRCLPCTVVNLVVAGVGVILLGLVWVPAGFAAFVLAVGLVYLRGYLVPGTPGLTKRYLPDAVLRRFGKNGVEPRRETGSPDGDVGALLRSAGAATDCARRDDLCLDPTFREEWRARIEAVRGDDEHERFAGAFGVGPDGLELETHATGTFAATRYGMEVGRWPSRTAFLADVGGAETLSDRWDGWGRLDADERGRLLGGLRLLLDRCPACDGPVTFGEETVESCCLSTDVVAVTCRDCDARLFEVESDGLDPA